LSPTYRRLREIPRVMPTIPTARSRPAHHRADYGCAAERPTSRSRTGPRVSWLARARIRFASSRTGQASCHFREPRVSRVFSRVIQPERTAESVRNDLATLHFCKFYTPMIRFAFFRPVSAGTFVNPLPAESVIRRCGSRYAFKGAGSWPQVTPHRTRHYSTQRLSIDARPVCASSWRKRRRAALPQQPDGDRLGVVRVAPSLGKPRQLIVSLHAWARGEAPDHLALSDCGHEV